MILLSEYRNKILHCGIRAPQPHHGSKPRMSNRPFLWEKSYTADLKWDLDVPDATIVSMFIDATEEFQNRPALEFRGKELSFTDLRQKARRAANAFLSIGI